MEICGGFALLHTSNRKGGTNHWECYSASGEFSSITFICLKFTGRGFFQSVEFLQASRRQEGDNNFRSYAHAYCHCHCHRSSNLVEFQMGTHREKNCFDIRWRLSYLNFLTILSFFTHVSQLWIGFTFWIPVFVFVNHSLICRWYSMRVVSSGFIGPSGTFEQPQSDDLEVRMYDKRSKNSDGVTPCRCKSWQLVDVRAASLTIAALADWMGAMVRAPAMLPNLLGVLISALSVPDDTCAAAALALKHVCDGEYTRLEILSSMTFENCHGRFWYLDWLGNSIISLSLPDESKLSFSAQGNSDKLYSRPLINLWHDLEMWAESRVCYLRNP